MNAAGTAEVARQTIAHDALTKWGNARFAGLAPGTSYTLHYDVNGTRQADTVRHPRTLPQSGAPLSFRFVTGSCQFTASNHPVFDRMREENPVFIGHMGDLHYVDATTDTAWRSGHDASLGAARFNAMLDAIPTYWSMDNHDRIMTNPGGAGTALNLGETDPLTASQWKHLAGAQGWASAAGLGATWTVGRVQFVHLDQWSARDDPDFDPEPRTFLGAEQKQWFKDVLTNSTAAVIVWLSQWTNRNNGNGRWQSFPTETAELEAWLNARPRIKRRMVMMGGDSHSPQASTGDYGGQANYRFVGIPSLNMSGFNRSGTEGDGSTGWDLINEGGRPPGALEADWGLYSVVDIEDDGTHIRFKWTGKKVDAAGVLTERVFYRLSFGQAFDDVKLGAVQADRLWLGSRLLWMKDEKGIV